MADRLGVPNSDPARYVGPHADTVPIKRFPRRPLTTDKKFPQGQLAILGKSPSTGSEGELWYLAYFDSSGDAQWKQFDISGAVAAVDDLRDQVNATIGPSGLGEIDIDGAVVANAANPSSIPLETVKSGTASTLDIQIQVAAAVTGAPGDTNDAGICSFDDTGFTVDADGYVELIGGGPPSMTNTGDDAVAVSPSATGNFSWIGLAVANATHAKPLYFKDSATPNALDLDIQVAVAITGAPGDKNDAGLCSFDDTAFAVDADGYVTLAGGAGPAVDTNTGDDAVAVSPSATGNFSWIGLAVANATHAKPVYFKDSATANAIDLDIQVATEITGAPGDKNDAGICSFDDTTFAADADGYVTLIAPGVVFTWTEVTGTSQAMAVNNGYVANNAALVTLTLPATAVIGDTIIIVGKGAGLFRIAQNAGQTIRQISSSSTTGAGGSFTADEQYDIIILRCITANTDFIAETTGAFTIV